MAPGAGKVTKLSALPPVSVAEDGGATSTSTRNESADADLAEPPVVSERNVEDMTKAELAQERRSLLMKLFADTGTAKIPAVIRSRQHKPKRYREVISFQSTSLGKHFHFLSANMLQICELCLGRGPRCLKNQKVTLVLLLSQARVGCSCGRDDWRESSRFCTPQERLGRSRTRGGQVGPC